MKIVGLCAALVLVATPAAAAPGDLFVHAKGVHRIDGRGKVTVIVPDKVYPTDVWVASDGEAWVATIDGAIYRGNKSRRLKLPSKSKDRGYSQAVAMSPGAGGAMWVVTREALFEISPRLRPRRHDLPVARVLGPVSLLAAGDSVWMASENGVHRFAGGKWELSRPGRHEHLIRDSNGTIWTVAKEADKPILVGYDGTAWREVAGVGMGIAGLAAGKDGRIYALIFDGGIDSHIDVLTFAGGKPKWTHKLGGADGLAGLVVDDGERAWALEDSGFVVLDKAGARLASLPQGTVPGLSGEVRQIAVAGVGPTQLPTASAVPEGSVTGRMLTGRGDPVAGATFRMCTGLCSDTEPGFTFTTDADGKFKTAGVRAIEYSSIVDRRGQTVIHSIGNFIAARTRKLRQLECCLKLKAGKTLDVGELAVPDPP